MQPVNHCPYKRGMGGSWASTFSLSESLTTSTSFTVNENIPSTLKYRIKLRTTMTTQRQMTIFATLLLLALTTPIKAATLKDAEQKALKETGIKHLETADDGTVEMTNTDLPVKHVDEPDTDSQINFDVTDEAERYVDMVVNTDLLPLNDKMVNHQQFTYLLNNKDRCNGDMFVLALIKSAPQRFMERQDIRKTWGSTTEYKGLKIVHVFTIGRIPFTNSSDIDNELMKENSEYGDIIQGDFKEHYKNQTYKTMMGLTWAHQFCSQANYILNTKDDIMVDPFHLVDFLQHMINEKKADNLLYCSTFFDQGPVRNPNSDNYITLNEYPYDKFPPHCEGFGYVVSKDVSEKMLEAAKSMSFLWLDEVFTTGFLPLKAGVKHCDMMDKHSYKYMQKSQIDAGIENTMFLVAKYKRLRSNWYTAWKAIEAKREKKK